MVKSIEVLEDLIHCITREEDPMPITVAISIVYERCGISTGIFRNPGGDWESYGYKVDNMEVAKSGWVVYEDTDVTSFVALLRKIISDIS